MMHRLLLLCLVGAAALVDADKCAFIDSAAPIEFDLPQSVLSSGLVDLPIKFSGLDHTVRRTNVPHGGKPKIIVKRYSTAPVIEYDEIEGNVVISSGACSPNAESGATTSFQKTGMAATAAALMLAADRADTALMGATVAAAAFLPQAMSRELAECTPTVEVLVEAPAAYLGAVEVCLAEVNAPGQCPKPFPTFTTCSDPAPICPVVVVGAGTGGLYMANRLVDEGKVKASDVCIFEMTERVGGRLFSLRGFGPNEDLSVDAGGYRTWPEFTPTLHELITDYLQIPMDCYDESEVPCQKFVIVDDNGKKAGFATFVEVMMSRLVNAGACYYPFHELDSFEQVPAASVGVTPVARQSQTFEDVTRLYFTNGVQAIATYTTILNIPQRPLLTVLRNSGNLPTSILNATKLDALHSVQTAIVTKLYLYYPKGQVFWRKLGLTTGDFELDGDATNMLLAGRYHDGHVECDDDNDPDTCHGFLFAVYAYDLSGNKAQFFRRYQRDRPEPITIMSNTDLEGSRFLSHAHSRLVQYHLYDAQNTSYTGFEATQVFNNQQPPEFGVLSTWNIAVPWAGGGWHWWTDLTDIELSMKPFVDNNIFVVNEAYSLLQSWAEGSIKLADELLVENFGVARPWSFPLVDSNQVVAQTSSQECVEPSDEED